MYQVGYLQLVYIKQDVYMYMSYVEALIWKGIYSYSYEGPWVWPLMVNGCGQ